MIYRLACVLTGVFCSILAFTQNTLMFSADYASNTNVLGNFSTIKKQPSYSPSLTFFSKWGMDMSLSGYAVDNSDDSLDHFTTELDLDLGYNFEPVRNLIIYPGYSHFIYSSNSNSLKSVFSDDFHLDIDYTYKFVNLGLSTGFLTGKQHTFYAAIHNSYIADFDHVLFRKGSLSLQPGIDANFGDYEYLNLYYLDELSRRGEYSNYLLLNRTIRRYVYFQKLRNPDLTREEILYSYLREKAEDTFKLTSAGFNLPIDYMIGNFSINLDLYAFFPINQPEYLDGDIQFFFNVGLNYMLLFK